MTKIGVLALQGAVREHVRSIEASGAEAVPIKKIEQLDQIDGLIIPGGESTTMRRLIDKYQFMDALKGFAESGKPVFGTCAGLILLAGEVVGQAEGHLELIDMKVERNAFGRQRESFEAELMISGVAEDFVGVFIRAPLIIDVGENVEILSKHDGKIVAVKQDQFIACAFHPELTDDHRLTAYFIDMVNEVKKGVTA